MVTWGRGLLPGEEGGEGKVAYRRRGRVALRGAQMEEGHALFPDLSGPSVRLEGTFKSRGSSTDSMAADRCSAPESTEKKKKNLRLSEGPIRGQR